MYHFFDDLESHVGRSEVAVGNLRNLDSLEVRYTFFMGKAGEHKQYATSISIAASG